MTKQEGINIYGYFNEFSGLSEAARSNIDALIKNNVSVNVNSFDYNNTPNKYNNFKHTPQNDASINLFHININFIENFIKDIGTKPFESKYNIAYWAWEFTEPPVEIIDYISFFDEIWVPSDFCVNAFNKIASIPVVKIPHAIALPVEDNDVTLDFDKSVENKFMFLTIFDSISSLDRKNPFATIKAFLTNFKDNPEVVLVIKTHNLELFPIQEKQFLELTNKHSNIILFNKKISKLELQKLISMANCYISLHRSEGFGLTMAEAMSYGKLVIGTGYSGNLEFMNINNSILVPYKLIESDQDYGLTKKGYIYAEPDIEFVSNILVDVVKNKNQHNKISEKGQECIAKNYSLATIGLLMKNRLALIQQTKIISDSHKLIELKQELLVKNSSNDQLIKKVEKLEKNIFIKIKYWFKNKNK